MKRQVILTDWKNGKAPITAYEDHGPSAAESRHAHALDTAPYKGRETECGGKVKPHGSRGRDGA